MLIGPASPSLARELMLICKLLQSLSNRVIIDSKEDFMAPLAGFVEENVPVVDKFYIEIEVPRLFSFFTCNLF